MFEIDMNTILYIIISILVLSNIYLLYKTRKIEYFADPPLSEMVATEVIKAVNNTYLVDISAMRNLANISQDIMTNKDSLKLPTNITIPGNLTVDGNVFLTNRNTNLMDIFPKFMIIAWGTADGVPKGWALCDGRKYKMNPTTGVVTLLRDDATEDNMVITPDLRGRFILGAGQGDGLTNRELNKNGGEENHTLTVDETPSHSHDLINFLNWGFNCEGPNCAFFNDGGVCGSVESKSGDKRKCGKLGQPGDMPKNTGNSGKDGAHNNMPPFYVLIYIMKL